MNNPKITSEIHIALAPWNLTDDYNRHGAATLISILENCPNPSSVYLLYDPDLSNGKENEEKYNKSCYLKVAGKYACNLHFLPVTMPKWVNEAASKNRHTPGTMLRLYLPELLPNVDRMIYMDCDIIVNSNIAKLWQTPFDEYYIAACIDPLASTNNKKIVKYFNDLDIIQEKYFNAGMILMNLKKMRDTTPAFSETIFSYFNKHQDLTWLDQDLLNWFCHGEYYQLEEKYNVFSAREDALKFAEDGIIHYNGAVLKPWKIYAGPIDDLYWKYLLETPYCENRDKLLSYIRNAPDVKSAIPYLNMYSLVPGLGKCNQFKRLWNITILIWKPFFAALINLLKSPFK